MGGDRKQIDLEFSHIHRDFSCGLHAVGVEVHVGFFGDSSDFLDWLDRSDLVVCVHDRDEDRIRPECGSNIIRFNKAVT